ncbi:hypothetical protein GIB67_024241 [Kingdonia uniflora]|uniref:AP-3 complex subunit beta C-terminal domain-containing protein n=1 Tax=Kingdonia uniflora TaxID=39325 RepID=A0A7J7LZI9_9MAGN|nr:hypothetical protein GIB67_024241 [Kingdonia uniflora]
MQVIIQLARNLDSIKVPTARAMVVWMVGEYNYVGQIIPRILLAVLKYLAQCFSSESLEMKHQILNTTVKVSSYLSDFFLLIFVDCLNFPILSHEVIHHFLLIPVVECYFLQAMLGGKGEDFLAFKRVLSYILELAKCDLNYDVRDRSRFLESLLSPYTAEDGITNNPQNADFRTMLAENIFRGKTKSELPISSNLRFYLPGSLSQLVLHSAPGYEPLPKPCSLDFDYLNQQTKNVGGEKLSGEGAIKIDSSAMNDLGTSSGSFNEESGSDYSSHHSMRTSHSMSSLGESEDTKFANGSDPFIQFSNVNEPNSSMEENNSTSISDDFGGLMSTTVLESWLDGQPGLSDLRSSELKAAQPSLARISITDIGARVKPKTYTLFEPPNGNGLKVDYWFSSEISSISSSLVCVEVTYLNCSAEPVTAITLIDEESTKIPEFTDHAIETYERSLSSCVVPAVVLMEDIASLGPGQTAKRTIQVCFHHHLLPLKLVVCYNGKRMPVKLRPDIGYFVKPLMMDVGTFINKESQLSGMFEFTRSCTFANHIGQILNSESSLTRDYLLVVCQSLASEVLSNANVFLVSVEMPVAANFDDASGLCFRFSSEILSSSIPCLITVTVEGKCSSPLNIYVKVNCQETIFGLNLLNRVVTFLG